MSSHPESLSQLLWRMSRRMKWYTFILALILSLILTSVLMRQTHEIVCALAESKLSQVSGPIARELILGENTIVEEVFKDFKSELQALGAEEDLELVLYNEPILLNHSEKTTCTSRGLHSEIRFPIIFSGKALGRIEGQVSHFSSLGFFIYLLVIFLGLAITFRSLMRQITEKIQKEILQPIYKLSNNEQIQINDTTPLEVIQIQGSIEQLKTTLAAQERYDLALRVAHDIRSPVAALEMISGTMKSDPEESMTIMRSALNRIKQIANQLLETNRVEGINSSHKPPSSYPLFSLVKDVVSEVKAQFSDQSDLEIRFMPEEFAVRLFAAVNEEQFKITLSNLMINAAEVLKGRGIIDVVLGVNDERIFLEVRDNGPGIPKNLIPLLGTRGMSYNKPQGNGLGIYHAKSYTQSWNGSLEIESQIKRGSCFRITLPKATPPEWFPHSFPTSKDTQWICLDDDSSVHELWKFKAKKMQMTHHPICYLSSQDLIDEVTELDLDRCVFFIDYHLDHDSITGIELIHKLNLKSKALLVTHESECTKLQKQCIDLQIKMLPKSMIQEFSFDLI